MNRAVIETGGKQYRVEPGQIIAIEKIEAKVGSTLTFDKVLMVADDKTVEVGSPLLTSFSVTGEVIEQGKGDKIRVFTYKSKKRQRRTLGHRQLETRVKITAIGAPKAEKAEVKPATKPAAKASTKAPAKKKA